MTYYRNNNSGCVNLIFILIIGIISVVFLIKGGVYIFNSIDFSSSNHKHKKQEKKEHKWGEKGVDPVLRTSTGNIFQDPAYPNHYFDIRTICPNCKGECSFRSWNIEESKFADQKCAECYGTGHRKVPLSEMPKETVPYEIID